MTKDVESYVYVRSGYKGCLEIQVRTESITIKDADGYCVGDKVKVYDRNGTIVARGPQNAREIAEYIYNLLITDPTERLAMQLN